MDINTTNCTRCATPINPLDMFPGEICIECHAEITAHLTDAELHTIITRTFNTRSK